MMDIHVYENPEGGRENCLLIERAHRAGANPNTKLIKLVGREEVSVPAELVLKPEWLPKLDIPFSRVAAQPGDKVLCRFGKAVVLKNRTIKLLDPLHDGKIVSRREVGKILFLSKAIPTELKERLETLFCRYSTSKKAIKSLWGQYDPRFGVAVNEYFDSEFTESEKQLDWLRETDQALTELFSSHDQEALEENTKKLVKKGIIFVDSIKKELEEEVKTKESPIDVETGKERYGITHVDTFEKFVRVIDRFPIGNCSRLERLNIAMQNLRKLGIEIVEETGIGVYPESGIPIEADSAERLAYGFYSSEEITEHRNSIHLNKQTYVSTHLEAEWFKDWPVLNNIYDTEVITKFASDIDQRLSELSKQRTKTGEIYEPPNLIRLLSRKAKQELAFTFNIQVKNLNSVHVDAMILDASELANSRMNITDVIKKMKVEPTDNIEEFTNSLLAQVYPKLNKCQVYLIEDKKKLRSMVKSILEKYPDAIKKEELRFYDSWRFDRDHKAYKDPMRTLLMLRERLRTIWRGYPMPSERRVRISNIISNEIGAEVNDEQSKAYEQTSDAEPLPDSILTNDEGYEAFVNAAKPGRQRSCFLCDSIEHLLGACPKAKDYSKEDLERIAKAKYKEMKEKDSLSVAMVNIMIAVAETSRKCYLCGSADHLMRRCEYAKDMSAKDLQARARLELNKLRAENKSVKVNAVSVEELLESNDWLKNRSEEEVDNWRKGTEVLKVPSKHQRLIIKGKAGDKGVEVRYLLDSGCCGINLAGSDVLESLEKLNFTDTEIAKLPNPIAVSGPWKSYPAPEVTKVIRTNLIINSLAGPVIVENVYFHILNCPTESVLLGQKFQAQTGMRSLDDQLSEMALSKLNKKLVNEINIPEEWANKAVKVNMTSVITSAIELWKDKSKPKED